MEFIPFITVETRAPFVYGLVDPLEPRHVRYVGMAPVRAGRPFVHAKLARKSSPQPSHLVHWIRKIQSEGREPSVLVLEKLTEGSSRDLCGFVEACYIKSLREIGHRLTNVTDGGEGGQSGLKSPEYRAKQSEDRKRYLAIPGVREEIGNASRGRKRSEKALAKLSASMMGNTNGAGVVKSAEEREAIRVRTLGNQHCLGRVHKESSKEQCRETNIATWSDPERRDAHSALMKASWARRKAAKNGT